MIRFDDVFDRWVRPGRYTNYSGMLHRAETGQRLVGAVVLAHLTLLRGRPRWACVAQTVRRLLVRCRIGEWALATRLGLSVVEAGDALHPWKGLIVARDSGARGLNCWLTTSETCLRHFERQLPEAILERATRALGEELGRLCDHLGRASGELCLDWGTHGTDLVLPGGVRAPLSPLLEVDSASLRCWDGAIRRNRGRVLISLVAEAGGEVRTSEVREPDHPWADSPVFAGLDVANESNPLDAFVSDRPPGDGTGEILSRIVSGEDPLEVAEDLGNAWRSADRPVIVVQVTPWEDPFETLTLALGLDGREGPGKAREKFQAWHDARERRASAVPVLLLAGTDVRPAHLESLGAMFGDTVRIAFVTGAPGYDLYWPNRWRNRFQAQRSLAAGAARAPDLEPLPVRALRELGASPVEAWRDGASQAFRLDALVDDPAGIERLVGVVEGRRDILSEPLTQAWLDDGHATVQSDGSIEFTSSGWRDFWRGLSGRAFEGGEPSSAWEAGCSLRPQGRTTNARVS